MKKTEVPRSRYGHRTQDQGSRQARPSDKYMAGVGQRPHKKRSMYHKHASQRSKELDVIQGVGRNHAIVSKIALL